MSMDQQNYDSKNPFMWLDANNICAICTNILNEDKTSLNNPINNNTDIRAYQVLESISQFKLQMYGPNYVCTVCFKNITSTYKFQQICNKAQLLFDTFTQYQFQQQQQQHQQPPTIQNIDIKYESTSQINENNTKHVIRLPETEESEYVSSKKKVGHYKCKYCDAVFDYYNSCKAHIDRHEQKHLCSYCGKALGSKCGLRSHEMIHTGERPFSCGQCSRAFRTKEGLDQHLVVHTKVTPFKCDVCQRRFNRKAALRMHIKIHTGNRPHVCSECGKAFSQLGNLKKHMEMHQKDRSKTKLETLAIIGLTKISKTEEND